MRVKNPLQTKRVKKKATISDLVAPGGGDQLMLQRGDYRMARKGYDKFQRKKVGVKLSNELLIRQSDKSSAEKIDIPTFENQALRFNPKTTHSNRQ